MNEETAYSEPWRQPPSVARVVHYVSHGSPVRPDGTQAYPSVCRAAIVTEVTENPDTDDTVGLCVLNPDGMFFQHGVRQHEVSAAAPDEEPGGGALNHPGGTWHWPERV
jgi:hypothetical protein